MQKALITENYTMSAWLVSKGDFILSECTLSNKHAKLICGLLKMEIEQINYILKTGTFSFCSSEWTDWMMERQQIAKEAFSILSSIDS